MSLAKISQEDALVKGQNSNSKTHLVIIDTAYDGEIFNIAPSDVPEKKDDLVAGYYQLPAPASPTRLAVKIIDMLGEEVIHTAQV